MLYYSPVWTVLQSSSFADCLNFPPQPLRDCCSANWASPAEMRAWAGPPRAGAPLGLRWAWPEVGGSTGISVLPPQRPTRWASWRRGRRPPCGVGWAPPARPRATGAARRVEPGQISPDRLRRGLRKDLSVGLVGVDVLAGRCCCCRRRWRRPRPGSPPGSLSCGWDLAGPTLVEYKECKFYFLLFMWALMANFVTYFSNEIQQNRLEWYKTHTYEYVRLVVWLYISHGTNVQRRFFCACAHRWDSRDRKRKTFISPPISIKDGMERPMYIVGRRRSRLNGSC